MDISSARLGKFVGAALGLMLTLTLANACAPVNSAYKAPIKADLAEKAPVGLDFEVKDFKWDYLSDGRRLQVTGTIENHTKTARRGTIFAMLFDEKGLGVAMGESQISPAVLEPGQSGTFTIVAQTSRPKGPQAIKHLRLLTNVQAE